MRYFLFQTVVLGSVLCSTLQAYGAPHNGAGLKQSGRPNIIFILTDDQRWDTLGYSGNTLAHTPEMDALAEAGTYFKNAIVTTPICSASRSSIFTGLHERTHRYTFQTGPIKERFMKNSYPKLLKESGYYTGFYGKFGVKYKALDKLFDVYESYDRGRYPDRRGYYYKTLDGKPVHLTRYTGQKALEFIEQAPHDKPFCLSLSFSAPHAHDPAPEQYFWQKQTDYLFQGMDMPGPKLAEDKYFEMLPKLVRDGINRVRWTWRFDTPEKYQHSIKGYYRMIAGIDIEIGKIRALLKKHGLDRNTVIILMGDNGYFLGERQLAGKWLMYDNSLRVPLIVYDPRVGKHHDVSRMALNIDVPSTILDLAGVPRPSSWQGKSLLPLVNGEKPDWDRHTVLIEHLWETNKIPPSEGVRTDDWKYFRYCNDRSIEELYNLAADPWETHNLVNDKQYRQQLAELRTRCDALIQKYNDPMSGTPSVLSVEYIRDPTNSAIQDSTPAYSWVLPDYVAFQKGYQILVASSKKTLDDNLGDVWNSGQVRSKQSVSIEHQGKPLAPGTTYFWKVRSWDQDNRLSPYSSAQSFTTGDFAGGITTGDAIQTSWISPQSVTKTTDTSYFIDFGKDAFGTLKLNYTASIPETLTVRLGEKLAGPEKIDRKPGGTIRFQEVHMAVRPGKTVYRVELVPDKRNTRGKAVVLPKALGVVMPFRYCEIENATNPITTADVRQMAVHTYFDDDASAFSCSDNTLNQVWNLCKYSIKATSFAGLYVDGDRERIPYEADAYINQLGHYGVDREYAMAKQTIEHFMDHPTWPTEWLLHTALMAYQDYMYTGDLELVRTYYDRMKHKTLIELARDDGLISSRSDKVTDAYMQKLGFPKGSRHIRDIVDWPAGQKNTSWKLANKAGERDGYDMVPINTVVNCFFYKNMEIMSKFATLLGKKTDADNFRYMAVKVKKAINQKLFDSVRGIYIDGEGSSHASLHANMMPLAFGLVPHRDIPSVVNFVKSRGMACSVYGSQYLLEGLYKAGESQYALDLMRSMGDRSWWNMIRVGSTITLEAWDMKYKPNSDWNHAWGTAPANIIPRCLWGVTPLEPAFRKAQIKPQLGDLKKSAIKVPTIRGPITCSYTRNGARRQTYDINLPGNTSGRFVLDDLDSADVNLNGSHVNTAKGYIPLAPGSNRVTLKTNS